MADAICKPESLIGKCSCRTDTDCLPSETCYAQTCELRCDAKDRGASCPRGGYCASTYNFCVDPRRPDGDSFDPAEWFAKAEAGVPGHEPRLLHATYDEWNGEHGHLRVSFRGDGSYVIEIDGLSVWNRSLRSDAKPSARARELFHGGVLRGKGSVPGIGALQARSCPEYRSAFRAELVLVAEFSTLMTYRGLWTHPRCSGFPEGYVAAIWTFVERETGGALRRFDHARFDDVPLFGAPLQTPDLARLPCWPGQAWDGASCVGRPRSCPEGYSVAEGGCARQD